MNNPALKTFTLTLLFAFFIARPITSLADCAPISQDLTVQPMLSLTTDIKDGDIITATNDSASGAEVTVTKDYFTNILAITAGAVASDNVTVTIVRGTITRTESLQAKLMVALTKVNIESVDTITVKKSDGTLVSYTANYAKNVLTITDSAIAAGDSITVTVTIPPLTTMPTFVPAATKLGYPHSLDYKTWTDLAPPTLTMPGYLVSNTEPATGGRITQLSNRRVFCAPPEPTRYGNGYSKTPVRTGNYLYFGGTYPASILDAHNYSFIKRLSWNLADSYASRAWPGRVWGVQSGLYGPPQFGYQDITTEAFTLIHDFTDDGYDQVSIGAGEGTPSNNEKYWVFFLKKSSDHTWDIVSFDATKNKILGIWHSNTKFDLNSGDGPRIDSVAFSQSGRYVIATVYSNGQGPLHGQDELANGVHVFDRNMHYQRMLTSTVSHADLALLDDNHTDMYVTFENFGIRSYKLKDGSYIQTIDGDIGPPRVDYLGVSGHISCRSIKRPGWCIFSSGAYSSSGYGFDKPFYNMIIGFHLKDGRIEPWARAYHYEPEDDYDSYYQYPFAIPDWDGRRIFFGAAWIGANPNATNATAPVHSYVIEMPQ